MMNTKEYLEMPVDEFAKICKKGTFNTGIGKLEITETEREIVLSVFSRISKGEKMINVMIVGTKEAAEKAVKTALKVMGIEETETVREPGAFICNWKDAVDITCSAYERDPNSLVFALKDPCAEEYVPEPFLSRFNERFIVR